MKIVFDRSQESDRTPSALRGVPSSVEGRRDHVMDPGLRSDFAHVLEARRARRRRESLRARLARETAPASLEGVSPYAGAQGIALLQHVVDHVLPRLEVAEEVAALAVELINEEIGMRMEWEVRCAEGEALDEGR